MKIKTITAKEISKQLPMRVKSLDGTGMFQGTTIRFYEVNDNGCLLGNVIGRVGQSICVINPSKQFNLLH